MNFAVLCRRRHKQVVPHPSRILRRMGYYNTTSPAHPVSRNLANQLKVVILSAATSIYNDDAVRMLIQILRKDEPAKAVAGWAG